MPKDKIRQWLRAIGAQQQKLTAELESSQTGLLASALAGRRCSKTARVAPWDSNPQPSSSTLLTEDTGMPFHHLQAEQIQRFRDAWKATNVIRESRSAGASSR